jgi:hypothetical protein
MMKKIILAWLLTALSASILAVPYGNPDDYRSKISAIESARQKIAEKEKIIEKLKDRTSSNNIWNFIGRNSQEQSVQKRSRIITEISGLKDEIAGNTAILLKDRDKLAVELAGNVLNKDFMAILDFMDNLKTVELCGYEFITDPAVGQANDRQTIDYLRYKSEIQALRIEALDIYLKYLKVKLKTVQGAKLASSEALIESQIVILMEYRAKGIKSQELLNEVLNPSK